MLQYLTSKQSPQSVAIALLPSRQLKTFLGSQNKLTSNWIGSTQFRAHPGTFCLVPDRDGKLKLVVAGVGDLSEPWEVSKLPAALPRGRYHIAGELSQQAANNVALGWLLGTYRFGRYKKSKRTYSSLAAPAETDLPWVRATAAAMQLGRDLITTPAEDMGPVELSGAASALAEKHGAKFREIVGDDLLKQGYPAIHAVGRASSRAPRLIDLTWGDPTHPKVTLVGKGVCFDSGGLDLKPAEAMKLMKKDMGGAATVLAVASAVMELGIPVRLRVLIPAVENSVSGNAFRPLDVLATRKGISVEVGHTDAEGRLVLSDALTEADREQPELLVDVATLTGAARVALGTALPALFSSSDTLANDLLAAGGRTADPMWRLPLHAPYKKMLDSKVAELNNAPAGGYGGAITAALFLKEFVSAKTQWAHIDSMAYTLTALPGRPVGGEVFGARALLELLRQRYS
jgi:leucyl aminopeptidase